jgi:hypothetical protein
MEVERRFTDHDRWPRCSVGYMEREPERLQLRYMFFLGEHATWRRRASAMSAWWRVTAARVAPRSAVRDRRISHRRVREASAFGRASWLARGYER